MEKLDEGITKESRKIIVEALKTLKMVCLTYQGRCEDCPLRKDNLGNCNILYITPECYEINDSEQWRAFR